MVLQNRPRDLRLNVLVTGFRPFMGESLNASGECVRRIQRDAILQALRVPPSLNLQLQLQIIDDVEVVWTCDAELEQPRDDTLGARRVVRAARAMDGGKGADLVVAVGEAASLSRALQQLRLETFARNRARRRKDEVGNQPTLDNSPLFAGLPEYLETHIPPPAWSEAVSLLLERGLRVVTPSVRLKDHLVSAQRDENPAGAFICNETYYQLLRDSHLGQDGEPPSGRWVLPIHVGAFRTHSDFEQLADGLSLAIGSLLQSMLDAAVGEQGSLRFEGR